MRRFILTLLIVLFAIVLLTPSLLWAQSEVSFEELVQQVSEIFTVQSDVVRRLSAIETQIAPPPPTSTPTITLTPRGPTTTPTRTPTPVPSRSYPKYQVRKIFDDYESNRARADVTYHGKTIEVIGKIVDIEKKGGDIWTGRERYEVTLDGEGFLRYLDCNFPLTSAEEVFQLNAGQSVTLRGTVTFGGTTKITMSNCQVIE